MLDSKMLLPDAKLSNWIKQYWILKGNGNGSQKLHKRILPDGCVTITLILRGRINISGFERKIECGAYIVPPVTSSHFDFMSDDIFLIDIHLNPGVFFKLFKIPVNKLGSNIYKMEDLSINFDKSILNKILDALNDEFLIYKRLNTFLHSLINNKDFYLDDILLNLIELYKKGDLNKFFDDQSLSIRQIERKVKSLTGLTPKSISRLGRFYSVLEQMKFHYFDLNLTELALENKFSDQSHFIREFKSLSENTPRKFLRDINTYPQYIGLCNLTKKYLK